MSQAVPEPPASTTHVHTAPKVSGPGDLAKLALGALGVVYGDIGTSPLYAMKECFEPGHGMDPSRANVLGVLSLFVWSLTLVVVVKYLSFIMRADNKGEGGILALLALIVWRGEDLRRRGGARDRSGTRRRDQVAGPHGRG